MPDENGRDLEARVKWLEQRVTELLERTQFLQQAKPRVLVFDTGDDQKVTVERGGASS